MDSSELAQGLNLLASKMDTMQRVMQTGFDTLADLLRETNGRIDETNHRLDKTNHRLDETNHRLDETNHRLDETNHRLGRLEDRFDNLPGGCRGGEPLAPA